MAEQNEGKVFKILMVIISAIVAPILVNKFTDKKPEPQQQVQNVPDRSNGTAASTSTGAPVQFPRSTVSPAQSSPVSSSGNGSAVQETRQAPPAIVHPETRTPNLPPQLSKSSATPVNEQELFRIIRGTGSAEHGKSKDSATDQQDDGKLLGNWTLTYLETGLTSAVALNRNHDCVVADYSYAGCTWTFKPPALKLTVTVMGSPVFSLALDQQAESAFGSPTYLLSR